MIATDTSTSQEAIDLERCEYLLRLLAHGVNAGIAVTGVGINCVYCEWRSENYQVERLHEKGCPVYQARKFLRRVPQS